MMPAPDSYGGTISPSEGLIPAAPPRPAARPIASVPLQPTGTHILVAAETPAQDEPVETPQVPQAETPAKSAETFPFNLAGAPETQPAIGELVEKRLDDGRVVQFTADGDQICAHFDDFVNLQESPAGFGGNHEDALTALLAGSKPATNQSDEDAQGGSAPPTTTLGDDVPRG